MTRLAFLFCVVLTTVGSAEAVDTLRPDETVAGTIASGADREYQFRAERGDVVHVAVEQQRIDVVVELLDPGGATLASVNNAVQEDDPLSVSAIAPATGVYRLHLRPGAKQRSAGAFRLTLSPPRPADPAGELRVAADQAYDEALGLRARGTAESMQAARDRLDVALTDWRALGDRENEARTLLQIGEVVFRLGDVSGTRDVSERSLAIWRALGNAKGAAAALNNIAVCLNTTGDPAGALERYTEALPLLRAAGDRVSEGNLLNNIGRAYSALGNHQQALQYLEQALAVRIETGDIGGRAITLNNLGLERSSLGEPAQARAYHEQALPLYREAGDLRGAANALNNLGLDFHGLHEYGHARDSFQEALRQARTAGDERMQATTLHNIGSAYADEGRWAEAREYYSRALPLRRRTGDRFGEAVTLGRLGATYIETHQLDEAAAPLNEALRISDALGDGQSRVLALYHLARVERANGRYEEALERIDTLLKWFESVRSLVPGPDLRTSYFATVRFAYELRIDTLVDLHHLHPDAGYDARAFEASERARARSMLDLLGESQTDIHEGVDAALLERERRVRATMATQVERRIRTASAGGGELARLDSAIDKLAAELETIQSDLRTRSPRFAALTQPRPLTLGDLQSQVLDEDTALLEYALGESRSLLWVVTRSKLSLYELPPRAAVETLARRFYGETSAAGTGHPASAAALSRAIFPFDSAGPPARRLLIVAEGALQYVAFAALPGRSGLPLAVSHEVVSLPSASTLGLLRQEIGGRAPAPELVAVFADPVFDRSDSRIAGGPRARATDGGGDRLLRSASDSGVAAFDRLASSREEARAIAALADSSRTFVALDFDANRDAVLSGRLEAFRVVHFATHGLLDSRRPELSGLVLSLVDRGGRSVNGFLQLQDIYNLKLRADLVVLSACRTALGQDVRGEGLVGMTRAFMYAGAPRVIASLWEVPDRATSELMKIFYRRFLGDRMPAAAALRAAQLELRSTPRWSAPFYWAGFVLQGEPR